MIGYDRWQPPTSVRGANQATDPNSPTPGVLPDGSYPGNPQPSGYEDILGGYYDNIRQNGGRYVDPYNPSFTRLNIRPPAGSAPFVGSWSLNGTQFNYPPPLGQRTGTGRPDTVQEQNRFRAGEDRVYAYNQHEQSPSAPYQPSVPYQPGPSSDQPQPGSSPNTPIYGQPHNGQPNFGKNPGYSGVGGTPMDEPPSVAANLQAEAQKYIAWLYQQVQLGQIDRLKAKDLMENQLGIKVSDQQFELGMQNLNLQRELAWRAAQTQQYANETERMGVTGGIANQRDLIGLQRDELRQRYGLEGRALDEQTRNQIYRGETERMGVTGQLEIAKRQSDIEAAYKAGLITNDQYRSETERNLGNRQLDVQTELGRGRLTNEAYRGTTERLLGMRGYEVAQLLGLTREETQRMGLATNERLGNRGYDVQQLLGQGGLANELEKIRSGERLGMQGLAVEDRKNLAALSISPRDFLQADQYLNYARPEWERSASDALGIRRAGWSDRAAGRGDLATTPPTVAPPPAVAPSTAPPPLVDTQRAAVPIDPRQAAQTNAPITPFGVAPGRDLPPAPGTPTPSGSAVPASYQRGLRGQADVSGRTLAPMVSRQQWGRMGTLGRQMTGAINEQVYNVPQDQWDEQQAQASGGFGSVRGGRRSQF